MVSGDIGSHEGKHTVRPALTQIGLQLGLGVIADNNFEACEICGVNILFSHKQLGAKWQILLVTDSGFQLKGPIPLGELLLLALAREAMP